MSQNALPKAGFTSGAAWLLNRVHYLAKDGQRFALHKGHFQQVTGRVAPVLVLSRLGYDEHHESFPIASRRALKQVLQQRSSGTFCYHLIGELTAGQRAVITITPKAELVATCQQARVVVPISSLLAASKQTGLHTVTMPDGRFYQLNQLPHASASLPASSLVNTTDRALQLLGGHSAVQQYQWKESDVATLWRFLLKLPAHSWLDFFNAGQNRLNPGRWLPFLAVSGGMAMFYLFGASLLLSSQLEQRQQALSRLNVEVGTVLEARSQLQQADELFNALADYRQQSLPGISVWTIIALAQLNDISLTATEGDEELLRMQGNAPSATDWLQLLLSTDVVKSADFTAPVRRDTRGREQFAIAIQLQPLASQSEALEALDD